jgi:ABC-type phosphonate transport system ATPase subunit
VQRAQALQRQAEQQLQRMQAQLQQIETKTQAELQRIENKKTRVEASVSDQVAGVQQSQRVKTARVVSQAVVSSMQAQTQGLAIMHGAIHVGPCTLDLTLGVAIHVCTCSLAILRFKSRRLLLP